MKQLINYCPVHGYEQEVNAYAAGMKGYLKNNKLDGIELYVYQQKPYTSDYREESIGVHLKYWPYWLDFWYGNQKHLNENYSDKNFVFNPVPIHGKIITSCSVKVFSHTFSQEASLCR